MQGRTNAKAATSDGSDFAPPHSPFSQCLGVIGQATTSSTDVSIAVEHHVNRDVLRGLRHFRQPGLRREAQGHASSGAPPVPTLLLGGDRAPEKD